MQSEAIISSVTQALLTAGAEQGIDVVDVEIAGSEKSPILRVRIEYLDHTRPTITLDEIAEQNSWISEVIDELDPFENSYVLEVSSPGLTRPLNRTEHFTRFAGEKVSFKCVDNAGTHRGEGLLIGFVDGCVHIQVEGNLQVYPLETVRYCKLKPDFSLN